MNAEPLREMLIKRKMNFTKLAQQAQVSRFHLSNVLAGRMRGRHVWRCEDMGDGIDRQIIDRARRASYNQRHPIWANHVKLLGHAGSMQDKDYRRFKGFRQKIRDGSPAHALISFCFRDYSKPYQKYLNTSLKETQQASMSRDAFRRQWLGIWAVDGENYYPMAIVMNEVFMQARARVRLVQCTPSGESGDESIHASITLGIAFVSVLKNR